MIFLQKFHFFTQMKQTCLAKLISRSLVTPARVITLVKAANLMNGV